MKHYTLFALLDAVSGTVSVCESLADAEQLALDWKAEMLELATDSYDERKRSFEEDHPEESFKSFEEYLKDTDQDNGDLQIFGIADTDPEFDKAKALLKGGCDATGKLNDALNDRVESIYLWQSTFTLCCGGGEFKRKNGRSLEDIAIDTAMTDDYDEFFTYTSEDYARKTLEHHFSSVREWKNGEFDCVVFWLRENKTNGDIEIIDVAKFQNVKAI